MNRYVVDTHALYWYLTASPRLGEKARSAFEEGKRSEAIIFVPAIVLAELYFLNEKASRPLDFAAEYTRLRNSGQFVLVGFAPEDTLDFEANAAVPEMHDRMIVVTARRVGAICVSFDAEIMESGLVTTLW